MTRTRWIDAAGDRAARVGERLGRVERERAVGAEDVGRPHAAQLVRRLVRTADSSRACAESTSARPRASSRAQNGSPARSGVTRPPFSGNCHGPIGSVHDAASVLVVDRYGAMRRGIAMDEVVDAVTRGIEAGRERRPRHRTLRRHRRRQRRKPAHLREPREIRQAARLHQRARELIVEAVEPEHDHATPRRRARIPTAAGRIAASATLRSTGER